MSVDEKDHGKKHDVEDEGHNYLLDQILNASSAGDFDRAAKTMGDKLLNYMLKSGHEEALHNDMFKIMSTRRSTRKFSSKQVEKIKIDEIISAADTAPTAGNFQGFEIFYIKSDDTKRRLADACNNQRYVIAPVVMVFCKNPARIKFNFDDYTMKKFAIQDATLAAAYSQLAAHALELSSIWIGMFDERKVKDVIGTELTPSSILCIGYPEKRKYPKRRRRLKDLVHIVE